MVKVIKYTAFIVAILLIASLATLALFPTKDEIDCKLVTIYVQPQTEIPIDYPMYDYYQYNYHNPRLQLASNVYGTIVEYYVLRLPTKTLYCGPYTPRVNPYAR